MLRTIVRDPPPRNKILVLEAMDFQLSRVEYRFRVGADEFVSTIHLSSFDADDLASVNPVALDRVLLSIGLALAPFHFLLSDFSTVRVAMAPLPRQLRQFYSDYFRGGLAEFRYRNGLDPTRSIEIQAQEAPIGPTPSVLRRCERTLALNGGGKDSAVMIEALKATGQQVGVFTVNAGVAHRALASVSGAVHQHEVRYSLDPSIKARAAHPWGHMPYAALFLHLSQLGALVYGYGQVAAGNEYSANFANTTYRGFPVNHQYTKSFDFEARFDRMMRQHVCGGITYYSLLRPLHDLAIARIYATYPKYVGATVSCNIDRDHWCRKCPKCAFTYVSLGAFMDPATFKKAFPDNFLSSRETRVELLALMQDRIKPWECVGTAEESQLATVLLLRRYPDLDFPAWPRRSDLLSACSGLDEVASVRRILKTMYKPHGLPDSVESFLSNRLAADLVVA